MDEQQEQQKSGDTNTENSADPNTTNNQQQANAEAAKQQQAAGLAGAERNDETLARQEKRRQAFSDARKGPIGEGIDAVNAFINAMEDCDAESPEAMLADSDVQQAAKRAREGLKVFTGETPVTFSKPTSDAHLNVGSGGAVTGNTPANKQRAAAVRQEHGAADDEQEGVPGVAKVPQPDALVR